MSGQRDYLRFHLHEAIRRYCTGVLRKYSWGFAQDREDFTQQVWVEVCDNPEEESLALAELETHDRLAPCVKRRIRNAIDRQKRYWRRTRPIERQDLVALPNWCSDHALRGRKRRGRVPQDLVAVPNSCSDPVAKEDQWARVLGVCSPEEQVLLGVAPVKRTQREEANSQGITGKTFRNRRKRLLVRLKRVLNSE